MTPYNHVGMRKFVRNGHMGRPWQLPALCHRAAWIFGARFVGETHLYETPLSLPDGSRTCASLDTNHTLRCVRIIGRKQYVDCADRVPSPRPRWRSRHHGSALLRASTTPLPPHCRQAACTARTARPTAAAPSRRAVVEPAPS